MPYLVLFLLIAATGFAQKTALPSLYTQLAQTAPTSAAYADVCLDLVRAYRNVHLDSQYHYANTALTIAQELKDEKRLTDAHHSLLSVNAALERLDAMQENYDFIAERLPKFYGERGAVQAKIAQAVLTSYNFELDDAVDLGVEAVRMAEDINNDSLTADASAWLSGDLMYSFNAPEGIRYAEKAADLHQKVEDLASYANDQNLLVNLYRIGEDIEQMEVAFAECNKFANQLGLPRLTAISHLNASVHYVENDPARAIELLEVAVEKCLEVGDSTGYLVSLGNIGLCYQRLGRSAEAIPYLQRELAMAEPIGNDFYLVDFQLGLAAALRDVGKLDSAYLYLSRGYETRERILEAENANRIKEISAKYETEQKDELIGEQEATINRQSQVQLLTGGVILLLLLGAGVAYYGWRNNRRKNALLEEKNAENELLLKEIHHRVKNNLEVVSSLLELQSARLTDSSAQQAIQAGQSRVNSMGLLHQKLYQRDNLSAIEMREYFQNLAETLQEMYDAEEVDIQINMDELELDVDTAVPLGLIVNELLTNSIKYAFTKQNKAKITIEIQKFNSKYRLSVSDNGSGKDATLPAQGTGFGTRLIQLLTQQLGGQLTEQNRNGLQTTLTFPAT